MNEKTKKQKLGTRNEDRREKRIQIQNFCQIHDVNKLLYQPGTHQNTDENTKNYDVRTYVVPGTRYQVQYV